MSLLSSASNPKSELNVHIACTLPKTCIDPSTQEVVNGESDTQPSSAVAANLVNSVIQKISRCQLRMSQNERKLEDMKERLQKFEELADLLRTVSPNTRTLTSLTPLLERMRAECHSLGTTVEQDTKRLSEAWEEALSIFLRAICQQFDKEVEAGTEFLYQEARVVFDTLSKKYVTASQKSANSSSKPTFPLRPHSGNTFEESLKGSLCSQNQPISNNMHCQTTEFTEKISRIQEQLDRQSERIECLLQQNTQNIYGYNPMFPHFSL